MYVGLGRLYRIELVMHRRSRAGEMVYVLDLDIQRKCHVMANDLEAGMANEGIHIRSVTGKEIVDAKHVVTVGQ